MIVAVCRTGADCSTGEKCASNKCVVPCVTHSQCQTDQTCVNGACILGCRSNKNCPPTESCINNKCQGIEKKKKLERKLEMGNFLRQISTDFVHSFQIRAKGRTFAGQTRSVASPITRPPAPVPSASTGIPRPNRAASECRTYARVLRIAPVSTCACPDSASASAASRATVPRANVARTEYA